jgi:hypothetical protein
VADGSDHDIPEQRPEAIVQAVLSVVAQRPAVTPGDDRQGM